MNNKEANMKDTVEKVATKIFHAYDAGRSAKACDTVGFAQEIIDLVLSSQWVKCSDELPKHGQEIVGFAYCYPDEAGAHGVWDETWDKDEPIGAMTHWMPIPEETE